MNRELILLSPYRFPTHHSLMLNTDDVAILLNGYLALWHPEALRGAVAPPKIASPYDYELPRAGHVYAVPESPPLFLPEDWEQRVKEAGAAFFKAVVDRSETEANLLQAITPPAPPSQGGEKSSEDGERSTHSATEPGPFFGLGLGYAILEALFEAMDHLNQLSVSDFWQHVQNAVEADEATRRQHLVAAAEKLREARDVLYPSPVHLVDLMAFDQSPAEGSLTSALAAGTPFNLLLSGERLEKLARENAPAFEQLRQRVQADALEVCSGPYLEREDALLPLESQLWNLRKGLATGRQLLGQEIRVYGRRRFAASPELPQFVRSFGLARAVLLPFDEGVLPQFRTAVAEWNSQDGQRIEAFVLKPHPAESPLTYFHLAHYLSRTMMQDPSAALALKHDGATASSWHRDWLELHRLAPVFGQHVILNQFFHDVGIGEYTPAASADDFHSDYLQELTISRAEQPVSRFSQFFRSRRRLECIWTLAGLHRGITKQPESSTLPQRLAEAEEALEQGGHPVAADLASLETEAASALAGRLLSRATDETPGYLVFNPCNFSRRVPVELSEARTLLPAPARASQIDGDRVRAVIDIPALGFAWVPRAVAAGAKVPKPRSQLADERILRNEFLQAEVDPQSGGLRAIHEARGGPNRVGQQLVYGPGSEMRAKEIKVTSTGPALGEIISEGAVLDGHQSVLATFRQRFRLWWARPLLELRIELYPNEPPVGYPWHAYYGARFAWRDERAPLFRAVNLINHLTHHPRPETPYYLEIRSGAARTAILTGGLPFHQRHSQRMLDVILIPESETSRVFELALGLDLEEPVQAAMDFITSPVMVPTKNGPPHIGASGWLFHIDAANLVLTSLRPALDGSDAIIARLVESRGLATQAELRCTRNPTRAVVLDERYQPLNELAVTGDAVSLDFAPGAIQRVRVEFS